MRLRRALLVFFWCALLAGSAAATENFSGYERESLKIALDRTGGTVDPAPEGKVVEGIDVVALDVIEPRDPAPRFLNWFHVTSKDEVIRREALLKPGDRFSRALAEETERNLRVRQLSVVLLVATRGSAEDRVRLLLVTKDVWSLRVNWEPTIVNGHLQSLLLQPSEENFLGRHKIVNATVALGRATYSVGLGFTDPRVGGSRLQALGSASLIFNCKSGKTEGSTGAFSYGKPLYSMLTKWSWIAATTWSEGTTRPYGTLGNSICSDDRPALVNFRSTPQNDAVPYSYHLQSLSSEFSVTRSFGTFLKNDVSFGLESRRRLYTPPDLSAFPQDTQRVFLETLPVSDTRISPFVQLHAFRNKFLRVLDVETLGLQEDYRLGHDVWLRVYPALQAVGSSRDLLGVYSGLGYTVPLGDGLARAYAASTVELSRRETSDAEISGGARLVTPRLPFGRLVLDGFVQDRYENYLKPQVSLGGTSRLRGYRTQAFVGSNAVTGNIELRSRPIEVLSVQVGAALFYDVGDAFDRFDEMRLKHGVGGGLRFVFPQLERTVLRIEVGVPLNRDDPAAETSIIAQFRQAFTMPALTNPGLGQ